MKRVSIKAYTREWPIGPRTVARLLRERGVVLMRGARGRLHCRQDRLKALGVELGFVTDPAATRMGRTGPSYELPEDPRELIRLGVTLKPGVGLVIARRFERLKSKWDDNGRGWGHQDTAALRICVTEMVDDARRPPSGKVAEQEHDLKDAPTVRLISRLFGVNGAAPPEDPRARSAIEHELWMRFAAEQVIQSELIRALGGLPSPPQTPGGDS